MADDLVTLSCSELDQQPTITTHMLTRGGSYLDRTVDHQKPRALVDLVVGQALARREGEHDRARLLAGGEDLRQP